MRTLYLLRHAKSSWDDPALADRDRPLARRGMRAGAAVARHVAANGISPALVLCSPARRAVDTLDLVAPAFRGRAETLVEEDLYGAGSGDLLRRLRRVPAGTPSVMVVGHNPALHELALTLARSVEDLHRLREKFPAGALATLAVSDPWRELGKTAAELVELVMPRDL
jgi:phosphohistidine phosphatase